MFPIGTDEDIIALSDVPFYTSCPNIPQFYKAIHAYSDTLLTKHDKDCFYYQVPLEGWEYSMRTNMGGGLPIGGFYEMKQEIHEIANQEKLLISRLK